MLEKTAASLEPCGIHRILPCSAKSLGSKRQLHTAFWQHGAAELELNSSSDAVLGDSSKEPGQGTSLNTSPVLLDFLYPNGAITLMRRLSTPATFELRTRPIVSRLGPRLYSSTAAPSVNPAGQDEGPSSSQKPVAGSAEFSQNGSPKLQTGLEMDEPITDTEHMQSLARALDHLLANASPRNHSEVDEVWHHFKLLDQQRQDQRATSVVSFLSQTGRLFDAWKISELFHKLSDSELENRTLLAAVNSELMLQNNESALKAFLRGLDLSAITPEYLADILDLLLANALRSATFDLTMSIWQHFQLMTSRLDFKLIHTRLTAVASVPQLASRAVAFRDFVLDRRTQADYSESEEVSLDTLQKLLFRKGIVNATPSEILQILSMSEDPLVFEESINQAVLKGDHQLAVNVYKRLREIPRYTPSRNALLKTFQAYRDGTFNRSMQLAGLENLWGDWHRFHQYPSRRVYQHYLTFHASRGDIYRVHQLWKEYVQKFSHVDVTKVVDTFSHLLHVHAVCGEPEEIRRIMNAMINQFRLKPNIYCWNILLNAQSKAYDYEGAIDTFNEMTRSVALDKYSFSTMMQMSGSRGDLDFTVSLYRRARREGVRADDAILGSLVEVYCQNNYLQEAENMCVNAASSGLVSTRTWNKLLHYHALRRDLNGLNKILNLMAQRQISYDRHTYAELFMALGLCRQSQHAIELLGTGLRESAFMVTAEHFYTVMGALIKTGEPRKALRLLSLMEDRGISSSSNIMFRVLQSLAKWKETELSSGESTVQTLTSRLGEAFKAFHAKYSTESFIRKSSVSSSAQHVAPENEVLKSGTEEFQFGTLIYIFSQLSDFVHVEELVSLYRYAFQNQSDILPARLMAAIMSSAAEERKWTTVHQMWHNLFSAATKAGRSPDYAELTPKISPRYRYILGPALQTMFKMLHTKNEPLALTKLVKRVLHAGFLLSSKNWNTYVEMLITMRQYKDAFLVCERELMPNWLGWNVLRKKLAVPNEAPLAERQMGTHPYHKRPTAHTLYHLVKGWVELEKLSPWSNEAGALMREIEETCPQSVRAVKSVVQVHDDLGREIFGEPESVADDFLEKESLETGDAGTGNKRTRTNISRAQF